jgi:hypothetical protein
MQPKEMSATGLNSALKEEEMSKLIQKDQWVWVLVQDPGKKEQLLGQQNEETDELFIPAFLEKEEARRGLTFLTREEGHTYEAHAIQYDDLAQRARENGFKLMILSGAGQVLERITP